MRVLEEIKKYSNKIIESLPPDYHTLEPGKSEVLKFLDPKFREILVYLYQQIPKKYRHLFPPMEDMARKFSELYESQPELSGRQLRRLINDRLRKEFPEFNSLHFKTYEATVKGFTDNEILFESEGKVIRKNISDKLMRKIVKKGKEKLKLFEHDGTIIHAEF